VSVNSTAAWPEEQSNLIKGFRLTCSEYGANDIYRLPSAFAVCTTAK
jgi:hypothetical protein